MASLSLSRRDVNVLGKIKDPESDPSSAVHIDSSYTPDPQIRDPEAYRMVSQKEREIIQVVQQLEIRHASKGASEESTAQVVEGYRCCLSRLGHLIQECPRYASARNNRAQAIRRLCGDSILLANAPQTPQALLRDLDDAERIVMADTALSDLDLAIRLLSPVGIFPSMSPQAARTLSAAHTQRAALYLMTSKLMSTNSVSVAPGRREEKWTKLEFEENASRDFAMGGRYGNDIAKGLAVSTNPTAKLCGQMVREAMKKEYGEDFPTAD